MQSVRNRASCYFCGSGTLSGRQAPFSGLTHALRLLDHAKLSGTWVPALTRPDLYPCRLKNGPLDTLSLVAHRPLKRDTPQNRPRN